MGRGLSQLQKDILRIGYGNLKSDNRPPSPAVVCCRFWPIEEDSGKVVNDDRVDRRAKKVEELPQYKSGYEARREERERYEEFVEPNDLEEQGRYDERCLFKYRSYGPVARYRGLFRLHERSAQVAFLESVEEATEMVGKIEAIGFPAWVQSERTRWFSPGNFYYKVSDVYVPEVLADHYDLADRQLQPARDESGQRNPGQHFDRSGLEDKFESARAAISRSFRRLQGRGLCVGKGAVRLTSAGVEKAEELFGDSNG